MNEIIRVKNRSYDRYEELLMRRDALRKEALQYERAYIREFGDLILEVFQLKLECIRKKKTIEFCQAAVNFGQAVDQDKLQNYLTCELSAFQEQLNDMIEETESAKKDGTVTDEELLQIKKIYHKLVKQIHPDINPMVAESPTLQELWYRVQVAYNCNDLKMMQETETLVAQALKQLGDETIEVEIPDIEGKIAELEAEIKQICETEPYTYKYLLEDPEAVKKKKEALREEKKIYEEYSKQLDELLANFLQNGVSFKWRMN